MHFPHHKTFFFFSYIRVYNWTIRAFQYSRCRKKKTANYCCKRIQRTGFHSSRNKNHSNSARQPLASCEWVSVVALHMNVVKKTNLNRASLDQLASISFFFYFFAEYSFGPPYLHLNHMHMPYNQKILNFFIAQCSRVSVVWIISVSGSLIHV